MTPGRCIVYGILGFLVLAWLIIGYLRDRDFSITALTSKNGYVLDIRTPYFSEMTQLVFCQIRKDNKILFHRMIGTAGVATNKLKFSLVETKDGILAITEQTNPQVVIGIFDTTRHKGVPFSSVGSQEDENIGKELIQRLNESIDGGSFILGGGVLGWKIQERE